MPLLLAVLQLCLAALLSLGLDWLVLQATAGLGVHALSIGWLGAALAALLVQALLTLPLLLLTAGWLRLLGGAPGPGSFGSILQGVLTALLLMLLALLVMAVLAVVANFALGLVLQAAVTGPGGLQTVVWIQAGVLLLLQVAVLMFFLPAILRHLGGVPKDSVAYRSGGQRWMAFGILLLSTLLMIAVDRWAGLPALPPQGASDWLMSGLRVAIELLITAVAYLVIWRQLWRPVPAAAWP